MTNEQMCFIENVAEATQMYYEKYRILPSLTIAQAIKESNWGKSKLSQPPHFNFFGLKWTAKCKTAYVEFLTTEYYNGVSQKVTAKFRSFGSFPEGIKGYYDFLSGYKRYHNLIGETDPATACVKIQQDGYATSPTYATSLYNDYIVKYNLTKYDKLTKTDNISYVCGNVYTLQSNMYIRETPNGVKKDYNDITVNARLNGYPDVEGKAILKKGTRVTCLDVVTDGSTLWMLIPSGYVCIKTSEKIYIK